jgi:hypothetical protein
LGLPALLRGRPVRALLAELAHLHELRLLRVGPSHQEVGSGVHSRRVYLVLLLLLLLANPVLVKARLLLLQVEVWVGHIQLVLLGKGAEVRPAVTQASHARDEPHEILPLLVCWLLNG